MAQQLFPYTHITVADEGFRITIECDSCDFKRVSEKLPEDHLWIHLEQLHLLMAIGKGHLSKVHGQFQHLQEVQEVVPVDD